jgi:hypothetical protein
VSVDVVRTALSKLSAAGEIRRVRQGLYTARAE